MKVISRKVTIKSIKSGSFIQQTFTCNRLFIIATFWQYERQIFRNMINDKFTYI